ncbi:MAG: FAD-dependent oxidoreductase, partial [Spirochaetia bacterium]|nr:FAD-dependent oxidoreductase [Spirochaetia bacterium]
MSKKMSFLENVDFPKIDDPYLMKRCVDVLVVGGGTAGTIAAIQSARAGADTLLLEKNGMLGGTMTVSAVNFPGLFHAEGRQVIAGIGWDLVKRSVETIGEALPDFSDPETSLKAHWRHHVDVPRAVYASLAEEEILGAGGSVLYNAMVGSVRREKNEWKVAVCLKEGLEEIAAKALIDATGDAQLTQLAGFERRRNAHRQPGTQMFEFGGYDLSRLDLPRIEKNFNAAASRGEVRHEDAGRKSNAIAHFLRVKGRNANHIVEADGSTSASQTEANVEGRRSFLRLYRFLKKQPGLENIKIIDCASECGIRETWTIVGKKTITVDDYRSGKVWDDAVCNSWYPVDIHRPSGDGI